MIAVKSRRGVPEKLELAAAFDGYTVKYLSEQFGVDLGELQNRRSDLSKRRIIAKDEYIELKKLIEKALAGCAALKERPRTVERWLRDFLSELDGKVLAEEEISLNTYMTRRGAQEKVHRKARSAFSYLLKSRYPSVIYFPRRFGDKLPEGAEFIAEKHGYQLYRKGNNFYLVGDLFVRDRNRGFYVGRTVVGRWLVNENA